MGQGKDNVGFNALLEDVFGLNIRGLRTIGTMVVRPRDVAAAARTENWAGLYTPSLRVIFFLLTLASVLRFLWFPEDGALFQSTMEILEDASPDSPYSEEEKAERLDRYIGTYLAAYPFFYIVTQLMAAYLVRIWGTGTSFVERVRLHMAALIPSVSFSALTIIGYPVFENLGVPTASPSVYLASIGSMFVIDVMTASRIAAGQGLFSKVGKALVFAFIAMIFGVAGAIATSTIGTALIL